MLTTTFLRVATFSKFILKVATFFRPDSKNRRALNINALKRRPANNILKMNLFYFNILSLDNYYYILVRVPFFLFCVIL